MIVRFGSRVLPFVALLSLAACSGDKTDPVGAVEDTKDGGSGTGDPTLPSTTPSDTYRSYVILGDSISDQEGIGGDPFFYTGLEEDFSKRLGSAVTVEKNSAAGAVSAALPKQVAALPTKLEGPVAVTVTIGGNDMSSAISNILNNADEKQLKKLSDSITAAYDELTKEGRFGEGVKVKIFHANIYDPTDGEGTFAKAGCPGILAAFPPVSTTEHFDRWNKVVAETVAKYGDKVVLVDMHKTFLGKGVMHTKDGTGWFLPDCIHPNTAGHAGIRSMFSGKIFP